MERYHTIVKLERLRNELSLGKFDKAFDTVLHINISKLKSMSDLSLAAEAYAHAGKYEKARDLYAYIYERTNSKRILSKLVHVYIKLRDAASAQIYLDKYDVAAPGDYHRYIYRYNLYRLQRKDVRECISLLVELKEKEYIDYWVYELAKLYHKSGETEKCINECDDIILLFGEGEYVEKAKALRAFYKQGMDKSTFLHDLPPFMLKQRTKGDAKVDYKKKDEEEFVNVAEDNEIEASVNTVEDNEIEASVNTVEDNEIEASVNTAEDNEVGEFVNTIEDNKVVNEDDLIYNISRSIENAVDEITNTITIPQSLEMKKAGHSKKLNNSKKTNAQKKTMERQKVNAADHIDYETKNTKVSDTEAVNTEAWDDEDDMIFQYPIYEPIDYNSEFSSILKENNVLLEEIFGFFYHIPTLRNQIITNLEELAGKKRKGAGTVITDDMNYGHGRKLLAKRMAKALCRMKAIKSNKAAVLNAAKINNMYLPNKKDQLINCCIIIEDAVKLSNESLLGIKELYNDCAGKIIIILEGGRSRINKKLKKEPEMAAMFSNRLNIPECGINEWKQCIYEHFKSNDYELSVKAESMLGERIKQLIGEGGDNFDRIMGYAGQCIKSSEKRSSTLLHKLGTDLRLNSTQLMVIRSEDLL